MKQFTPDELLDRWEWRREIKNVMGRLSHAYVVQQHHKIYENFWAKRADVCLGLNNGYYNGAEAVSGYYKALGQEVALSTRLIMNAFPEHLAGKTEEECFGVGMVIYKPVDTQIIEIAEDGQTAKGIWAVRGSYNKLTLSGPIGYWEFGWMAVDFVQEDGAWKIWHLLMVDDIDRQAGCNWCEEPEQFELVPEFAEMASFQMPKPNIPCTVREYYHGTRPFTPMPRLPEPYETFEHTFSYGYTG